MKQHHHPEGLQMINRVRSPVVAFELGKLEVWRDRFLHDYLREGRVSTNILTMSGGRVAEFFNPSVHLLEPSVQEILSTSSLEGPLAERGQGSSRGGVVVRLRALYPRICFPGKDGAAGPGGPPRRRVLTFRRCPFRVR